MKRGIKIAIGLGILGAAIGGLALATRKAASSSGPVPADAVPAALRSDTLPEGWTTYGWYTYKGPSAEKLWIRVDRGPTAPGTVLDDLPWHWAIFVDKTDASGNVPIAQGDKTWTDLGVLYRIDALAQYAEDDMAAMVVRAAAEQIDAMYSEAAA